MACTCSRKIIPEFKFALREDLKDRPEFLPTQADPEATGWDVRCAEPGGIRITNGDYFKIRLGFRMFAPPGWWLELRARSSTFAKKKLHSLYGVIDETYENEVLFGCQYCAEHHIPGIRDHNGTTIYRPALSDCSLRVDFGERIGQIVPVRRQVMTVEGISNEEFDRLADQRSAERQGGFGSTGEK